MPSEGAASEGRFGTALARGIGEGPNNAALLELAAEGRASSQGQFGTALAQQQLESQLADQQQALAGMQQELAGKQVEREQLEGKLQAAAQAYAELEEVLARASEEQCASEDRLTRQITALQHEVKVTTGFICVPSYLCMCMSGHSILSITAIASLHTS